MTRARRLVNSWGAAAVVVACGGSGALPTDSPSHAGQAGAAAGRAGFGGAAPLPAAGASGQSGGADAGRTGSAGRATSAGASGTAAGAFSNAGSGGASGRGGAGAGDAPNGGVPAAAGAGADGAGTNEGGSGAGGDANASGYDAIVLADGPIAYLAMSGATTEPDLTGNGHDGSYRGGAPSRATLPNGDSAADFDGAKQYLTIPSAAALSITTKHELTWEAWIRPDVLQFPHATNGYVDWLGKCEEYAPTCEWEARLYSLTNSEDRCNRLSAYAFNPDGDLGSGAFWQQTDCGVSIVAGAWYHVVGEYTTLTQPTACTDTDLYPGGIDIWVNGVRWRQSSHGQTGCMSQYQVVPVANTSPVNVGTMAHDAWFAGAVGKLAIYDGLLDGAAIARHYVAMTGTQPTGSCADTCSF